MVGWHHRLNGHDFEQTQGDSEGQGSLAWCSPQGHEESDTTWPLNNRNNTSRIRTQALCVFEGDVGEITSVKALN